MNSNEFLGMFIVAISISTGVIGIFTKIAWNISGTLTRLANQSERSNEVLSCHEKALDNHEGRLDEHEKMLLVHDMQLKQKA